jgi:AraC-like DNA-binding protein
MNGNQHFLQRRWPAMICLELTIPPLPQLVTIGHAVWPPGIKHLSRVFDVYDMLFVNNGVLYMTEDNKSYEITEGNMLVLEPGKHHIGHQASSEATEIYWVHFVHDAPVRTLDSASIPWSFPYAKGTDLDLAPHRQTMYLPKFADFNGPDLLPVLNRMLELHHRATASGSLLLQAELASLLVKLQEAAQRRYAPRSRKLCDLAIAYLQRHATDPFSADHMEKALHYRFDYIARCLKLYTGKSPLQFKHGLQISEARSLLANADLSVAEVGERVGIDNVNYFIRLFRKETGITPGQYRSSRQGRA